MFVDSQLSKPVSKGVCEKVYERSGKNLFWSIKHYGEVINEIKLRGFRANSLSTYGFSALYTTLPHNLFKENH